MNKIKLLLVAGTVACLFSCSKKAEKSNEASDTPGAPVESLAANSDYKPAFEGQTRIASVTSATPYEVKVLDSTLARPWGIAALPDGRFLITQKEEGTMRIAGATGRTGTA